MKVYSNKEIMRMKRSNEREPYMVLGCLYGSIWVIGMFIMSLGN